MSEEFGGDIITITDDDGVEYELEHLDTLDFQGETYVAFATAESADNEEVEIVIFRTDEEDGEEVFEAVEDESLLEEVYNLFMERIDVEEEDE